MDEAGRFAGQVQADQGPSVGVQVEAAHHMTLGQEPIGQAHHVEHLERAGELMQAASGAVLKAIRDFNATHPREDKGPKKSSGPKVREGL